MIKDNELRLGNYVFSTIHEKIMQITCIVKDVTVCAKPILLTEEILLKCGFDTEFTVRRFHRNDMPLDLFKYRSDDYWFVKSSLGDKITAVRYLHQIQNLYFALTGNELEIKL